MHYSIDEFGKLAFVYNEKVFELCNQSQWSLRTQLSANASRYCQQECKRPCRDYQYNVRLHVKKVFDTIARIRFRFDTGFVVVFTSLPKMSAFDLLYEVGGLVSLWFGYSLINSIYSLINLSYSLINLILKNGMCLRLSCNLVTVVLQKSKQKDAVVLA